MAGDVPWDVAVAVGEHALSCPEPTLPASIVRRPITREGVSDGDGGWCRRGSGWYLRAGPRPRMADDMLRRRRWSGDPFPITRDGVPDGDGGTAPPRLRMVSPGWPEAEHGR